MPFSQVGISGRVQSAGKLESSCGTLLAEQLPSKCLQKSLLNLTLIPVIVPMQSEWHRACELEEDNKLGRPVSTEEKIQNIFA